MHTQDTIAHNRSKCKPQTHTVLISYYITSYLSNNGSYSSLHKTEPLKTFKIDAKIQNENESSKQQSGLQRQR